MGVDTDESRHKHRGWAQTTKAEWTQTDLTQTVRHLGTKDRGQKDRRVERHTVAERSRVDRKTQLDKHTVYTNKEIGHIPKQGHIQSEQKCEWVQTERQSHKQGYRVGTRSRVGTNTDKSRYKHIESGHKQHKQSHG